jgi:crotonobetainyl-CoA:carnitine CoA-transferase CaiB-like acyl-CoA transferase
MRERNPRLTVVSMGGMGQDGPWSRYLTFAPTIHALTGLTYLTNPPGEHLLGYGFSLTDHLSGLAGAIAVLEGVEHARRTGEGLAVDLSQYELGFHIMAPGLIDALANGTAPEPVGNAHPFGASAPHGIYRAEGDDRWVAIAVRGDREWSALAAAMGRPELAADPRFATHDARIANQGALDRVVEDWTTALDRYAVMAICQAAGVAAGAVQDASDLTGADPYLRAREFFGEAAASSGTAAHAVDRFPARFDGARPSRYVAAAGLGADTFDILTDVLGMDADEVAELAAEGVLA